MTAGGGPAVPRPAAVRRGGPAAPRRPYVRRACAAALAAALALAALMAAATPAAAATYRFWSFWQQAGGGWQFARQGPATLVPADGDVEGWRFAVSAESGQAPRPRGPARFTAICRGTPAVAGRERIALVLDFGTAANLLSTVAPPPERTACASVPRGATAADALAAVARPLRYGSTGLVCGIAGYPATGCGESVPASTARAAAPPSGRAGGDPAPALRWYAGAGLIVLLLAGTAWQARRRSNAPR